MLDEERREVRKEGDDDDDGDEHEDDNEEKDDVYNCDELVKQEDVIEIHMEHKAMLVPKK